MKSPSRLLRFPLLCSTGLLALCAGTTNAAIVATGESAARNLTAEAKLTGALAGVSLTAPDVTVGPISGASNEAPLPYSDSTPGPLTVPVTVPGVFSLAATVAINQIDLGSTVHGAAGTTSTNARGRIADASAAFGLDAGLLGDLNLLTVDLNVAPSTVLDAYANLTSDGTTTTPTMSSNFISTGASVVISVLGVNIPITGTLVADTEFTVTVGTTASIGLLTANITGTIRLTPDWQEYNAFDSLHQASAASLMVIADLKVRVPGLTTPLGTAPDPINVDLDASIAFNQVSAEITSVTPAPEPSAAVLTGIVGAFLCGRRRRTA